MYRILFVATCLSIFAASFADADPTPKDGMQLHAMPAAKGELYTDNNGKYRYSFPKLTDMQVQLAPLGELSKWIKGQNSDAANALHSARLKKQRENAPQQQLLITGLVCSGPVMIIGRPDVLSNAQWDIVAHRIHRAIGEPSPVMKYQASSMLFTLKQCLRGDQLDKALAIIMNKDQIVQLIDQLKFEDIETRLITLSLIGTMTNSKLSVSAEAMSKMLHHLESSPYVQNRLVGVEPNRVQAQEVRAYEGILSSWRLWNSNMGASDEEFARRVIDLADSFPENDRQAYMIRILLGHTHGAPKIVMEYVTQLCARENNQSKRAALLILNRQVSYYENKDPASRAIAMPYAISLLRELANTPNTSERNQGVLMTVAASGRHLGQDAGQLLDVYAMLLDSDDEIVHMMAMMSLNELGSAARSTLPRLRELLVQGGDLEESIRETIYCISQEGNKPSWYDSAKEQRLNAMEEAGCFNIDPIQSTP